MGGGGWWGWRLSKALAGIVAGQALGQRPVEPFQDHPAMSGVEAARHGPGGNQDRPVRPGAPASGGEAFTACKVATAAWRGERPLCSQYRKSRRGEVQTHSPVRSQRRFFSRLRRRLVNTDRAPEVTDFWSCPMSNACRPPKLLRR